jgi:hypothetical protein
LVFNFYSLLSAEAANIPDNSIGKLPTDSSVDALSLAIESGDLVRALLQKNKVVMLRLHAMIFPKQTRRRHWATPKAPSRYSNVPHVPTTLSLLSSF